MIGVEFASWFFEFPAKNAGSSENSVSYSTCHWSLFLEIIVQEKFWGCKEFLRQNCTYGIQQRNIFLCGEMLLTLPYPFICFRCLYVSVYSRLQRGYFFWKVQMLPQCQREWCKVVQGKAACSCFSDSCQFCKPVQTYAPSQAGVQNTGIYCCFTCM